MAARSVLGLSGVRAPFLDDISRPPRTETSERSGAKTSRRWPTVTELSVSAASISVDLAQNGVLLRQFGTCCLTFAARSP